jgi:hypothetical protein
MFVSRKWGIIIGSAMQVFAREPVGSVEDCNSAPDLTFLAL